MLGLIDERWADYLTTLEHLKDNIRWQSLGQRDPLVEFKAEAFSAFQSFQEALKQEIIRYLFHSQIQVEPSGTQPLEGVPSHPDAGSALAGAAESNGGARAPQVGVPSKPSADAGSSSAIERPPTARGRDVPAVARNALCPCGSGKKYKRCHGAAG